MSDLRKIGLCRWFVAIGCFLLMVTTMLPNHAHAQNRTTLKGVVNAAEDGGPLPGVTVSVKGGNAKTVTNEKGEYSIQTTANTVLIFSHSGFVTREEAVNNRTTLNITLLSDVREIEDVVVAGYTTTRRKDLTSAVSSVNAKQLKDIPVNSVAEALTGRLAGVRITGSEGQPGAEFTVKIRGGGSVTQDNSPLYIIDGIQIEDGFAGLSPQDIETIDVLKDIAATAIYGARGANGVIIITTKGGKGTATKLSYNGMAGFRHLPKALDVMNPYDFVEYQYERSRLLVEETNAFTQIYGNDREKYRSVEPVNWQHEVFGRSAFMQTHNAALSGGSQTTNFNLSFTHNREEGIMINSDLSRSLVNFKLDHKASAQLRAGLNFRYSHEIVMGAGSSDEGGSTYNSLRHTIKYKPFLEGETNPDLAVDDEYYDLTNTGNGLGIINPILLNNAQYRRKKTDVLNIGGFLDYTLVKGLSFRSTVGFDWNSQTKEAFDGAITSNARLNGAGQPLIAILERPKNSLNNSNVLTWSRKNPSAKSKWSVLVGEETYITNINQEENRLRYFPLAITPEKAFGQLQQGVAVPLYPQSYKSESAMLSFFGRANYDYEGKYLASISFRGDASSKFAPDQRWGYFPSASVAWRISKENFMQKPLWLSDLKLRASYGEAGNNRIPDYLFMNSYSANVQYSLNEVLMPGYIANSLANRFLKWETTISRNIGIDASFFDNRLQLTVDAYKNTVRNLLIPIKISVSSGYVDQLQNVGATENTGLEIQLSGAVIRKKDFNWNSNFNISLNRNRVTGLTGHLNSFFASSGFGISGQPSDYIVKTGQPVGSMYGYETDGFYTVDDFDYDNATSVYTLKKGITDVSNAIGIAQPGWMKLKDRDGNFMIDENDKTIIGNATPTFEGGWMQQMSYKNFDLSIFVNFVYGNTIYNANKIEFTNAYSRHTNMLDIMSKRWKTIDQNGTLVQRVITVGGKQTVTGIPPAQLAELNKDAQIWQPISGAGAFYPTSWAMEDGSFLRLNNITLGYTLHAKLIKRTGISSLRAYVTANNLALITGYSGYDPEVNTRRATPLTPGVDYAAYPRSRSFFFGINLIF